MLNIYGNNPFNKHKIVMKITENAAQEQELAKEFKTLALEIFKTLSLPDELREIDGIVF